MNILKKPKFILPEHVVSVEVGRSDDLNFIERDYIERDYIYFLSPFHVDDDTNIISSI